MNVFPEILNRRDIPGRLPPNTVLVDRTTDWGNPFFEGTRDQNCEDFESWIMTQADLLLRLPELKGRHLMCWCAPLRCHAQTLRRLANAEIDFSQIPP